MSSIPGTEQAGTAARISAARGLLSELAAEDLAGRDPEALAGDIVGLGRVKAMCEAEIARRTVAADRVTGAEPGKLGGSVVERLAGHLGLTRGQAREAAQTAHHLERLPEVAGRLAAGELPFGAATEAARGLEQLDRLAAADGAGPVSPEAAAELDAHVAGASGAPRGLVRRGVEELVAAHAPDVLAGRERRAWARRHVWIGPCPGDPDGMHRLEGLLDAVSAATVRAAIDALAGPHGKDDPRDVRQRRADALTELARRALDAGDLPEVAVQRPHVILIRTKTPDGSGDTATLDGHGPVSQATADLIECDSERTTVTMDPAGNVVDAGVTGRDPSRAQRRAVIARDQACVGCGAPVSRCQVHHIAWVRHGGKTILVNLALACTECHFRIHHHGWVIWHTTTGGYGAGPPGRVPAGAVTLDHNPEHQHQHRHEEPRHRRTA